MVVRAVSSLVTNRRKLLGAAGAALFSSVAGCASIIEETADGPDTATTEATNDVAPTGTTTAARDGTGRPATERNVSEKNVSEKNVSEGNVSEPGDAATTTAGSESLGRITIDPPKVTVPKSLVPSDPGSYDYARMGSDDAATTATLYGNWKCPYTREFVVQQLGKVVEKFVKPGDVALEFRALSYLDGEPFLGDDAPRAARAGLEIWESDPERYWSYFASVFTNQPPERYAWATTDRLGRFADAADVDGVDLEKAMLNGAHRKTVRRTTDAAGERDVATVPRIATAEKVTAPTVDFEKTKKQLRKS